MSEDPIPAPRRQPVGRSRRARPQPVDPYQQTTQPRRVIIYTRVSREEEGEEGRSLEAQERECREFLEREKPHWTLVKVIRETHSGKNAERPKFQQMLNAVYNGEADAILTHHLDRFSRNLHDILTYFRELKDRNVILTFAKDRFDFSTEEGQLQFRILALFADWYLKNLGRETRKGKKARVIDGKHNNALPFGYRKDAAGVAEPVPEEAAALVEAYERYSTGTYTDAQIADFFNSRGLQTRHRRAFSKDSAREILQNETYLGLVKYQGDLYPGLHPAIISQDLFDRVQAVRNAHNRRPRLYSPTVKVYLLAGLALCAECGRTLRAQGGKTYNYYREMSKMRGFTDCSLAGKSIRQEDAEAQLERLITAFRLPADWQTEIRAEVAAGDEQQRILRERAKLTAKLERLGELYRDLVYSRARYLKERDALLQQLDRLVLPDPESTLEAGYQLETLADVWPYTTAEERQELCRLLFKAVYFDLSLPRISRVVPQDDFRPLFHHHPYLTELEDASFAVSAAILTAHTNSEN